MRFCLAAHNSDHQHSTGYTLLETLVALTLLITALSIGWFFFLHYQHSDTRQTVRSEQSQTSFRLLNHLRSDLRGGRIEPGGKDSIRILSSRLDQTGELQQKQVTWSLRGETITRTEGGDQTHFTYALHPERKERLSFALDTTAVGFHVRLSIIPPPPAEPEIEFDEVIPDR